MSANTSSTSTKSKKSSKQDLFEHPDFYAIDDLLTEEQKLIRSSIRDFVKLEISPYIEDWAQTAHFPKEIVKKFGDIGAFGPTIPTEYGGGGLDYISYGILMQEIERGDSGMRSTASVQGSLVMYPIYKFGSEEQRKKYLPKLGSGEWLGCFGLTEPDHGSNPAGMVTNFKDAGDHYILNGAKMWISNAPFADVAVVWAKSEQGRIHGLIVEKGMVGFTAPETHHKWSLRVSGLIAGEPTRTPLAPRPHCDAAIQSLLGCEVAAQRIWNGPAYCIDANAMPDAPDAVRVTPENTDLLQTFPEWRDEVAFREPFIVVVERARAVALCCSVRITPAAHEAGVETLPECRGRGFASQAVGAWARAVAALGALPLYSTSNDNVASQGVARRLGMHRFGLDFHVS